MRFILVAALATTALSACGGSDDSSGSAPAAGTNSAPGAPATTANGSPPTTPSTNTANPATYRWDTLGVANLVHIDATTEFTAVPGKYRGLRYLQTSNADKFLAVADAVAFQLDETADVLVAYDSRGASSLPSWLSSWVDTGDTLTTTTGVLDLYRKTFPAGTVTLGGNEIGLEMYVVIVDDGTGAGNTPPAISGNAPTEIRATAQYSFQPSVGDDDGDPLTFASSNLPRWASLDATTGAVTGTPTENEVGRYDDVTITVSDGAATVSLVPFSIIVTPIDTNSAPTISGEPNTVVSKDTQYTFVPSASDPDGDDLHFSVANLPPWANFYSAIGRIRGTPGAGDVGTYAGIVVSVTDGEKTTSLPPFAIEVAAEAQAAPPPPLTSPPGPSPNAAPTITGAPATSAVQGQAYSFTPSAADADSDPLTFSITNRPAWATLSASTGRLTGTPSAAGTFNNIVIRVTDGEATTALPAFSITVTAASPPPAPASPTTPPPPPPPNAAPTITGAPANTVNPSQAYAFTPSANDTDGDTLTFSIANRPSWATFNANTGRLSGTPSGSHVGVHNNITISVSDGEASASLAAFSITVQAVNSPPTITGAPVASVMQNQPYSFTPSADDADDDTLTFSISNRPDWGSFNSSTGRLTGTPDAGDVGAYNNIVISVSDGQASRSLAAFGISVVATATGSATLTWTPPTRNTDGSSLTNLAGYKIHWGRSQGNYTSSVTVNNPGLATYVVDDLTSGTWWFAVSARNSAGAESQLSTAASKTIQ